MFERYTEKARRVIFFARYEASLLGGSYIETEHILLGLLREDKRLAHQFLDPLTGVEAIRNDLERRARRGERVSTSVDMPLSMESKRVLTYAAEEAETHADHGIDTAHLFLGLLRDQATMAAQVLGQHGITLITAREEIACAVSSGRPDTYRLSRLAEELTQSNAAGEIAFNEAYDAAVDRLIEILWRRSKNNPVLVGGDAISRTAVVLRFAQRIRNRKVPEFFYDARIYKIELSRIAGDQRADWQMAPHLKTVLNELAADRNGITYFVDDLEVLFGSGSSATVLRPALYMGRLRGICGGTAFAYDSCIDADPLLRPHFEAVQMPGLAGGQPISG